MNIIEAMFADYAVIIWAVIGVGLLIVEVIMASGFFVSFSAAAFLVASATWMAILPTSPLWKISIFFLLGVGLVPICRKLLRRYADKTPDINQY